MVHPTTPPFCDKKPRAPFGICRACIATGDACSKLPCCGTLKTPTANIQCLPVTGGFGGNIVYRRCTPDVCDVKGLESVNLFTPSCTKAPTPAIYKGAVFCACPKTATKGFNCRKNPKCAATNKCTECGLQGAICKTVNDCCFQHTCVKSGKVKKCKRAKCKFLGETCAGDKDCCSKNQKCSREKRCDSNSCFKKGEFCSIGEECCSPLSCKINADKIGSCV